MSREGDRIRQLEQLAADMLSRYEDDGFPRVSQAKFDEWHGILIGGDSSNQEPARKSPDLRHPVSLRGIDSWLRDMADSLTAHAEQPTEVRDIAYSLRSHANAIRRDPEFRALPQAGTNPWADLYWFHCTEQLRGELEAIDERPYRECAEAPTLTDAERGGHLHGVPMHIAATIDQMRTEAVTDRHAPGLLLSPTVRCDFEVPGCEVPESCPGRPCGECGLVACGEISEFAVERSDHDPSYDVATDRAATESCQQHLAETVFLLMDGDDTVTAVVTPRWDGGS